jgi:NodT family efflux transporter outer membrane factor (OMF) lipoprotein
VERDSVSMRASTLRFAGVATVGMALCACGPQNVRPSSQLLDSTTLDVGSQLKAAESHAPWPNTHWWLVWDDTQLNALQQQAIAGQPNLKAAQSRLAVAQAEAQVAHAGLLPQAAASGDFGKERYPRYAVPSPPGGYTVWSNDVGAALTYDLDLWGKHRAETEGALDSVQMTAAETREVQLALETAVARTYIELSLQQQLHAMDKEILAQAQHVRDIARQRLGAGLGSQLELSQATTAVEVITTQLEQRDEQADLARHALAALIGRGPGSTENLESTTLTVDREVAMPSRLPAELIGKRPDIVAQRWRVESQAQGIKVARAAFYPNIDLLASAGLASTTPFGGFFNFIDNDAAGHRFGVAITLPIFSGGRLQGEYNAATARYDEAVNDYNQTVVNALQDVANQVTSLQSLWIQQQHAELATSDANKAYELARRGYASGITEFLDVLVSQTSLLRQQEQLATIKAKRLEAWALLMQALGGGLEDQAHVASNGSTPRGDHDER